MIALVRQKVVSYYGRNNGTLARNEWRRPGYPILVVTDTGEPGLPPAGIYPKLFGATAEFGLWEDTQAKLGPVGLEARRVYGILADTGTTKKGDLTEIIADGMTPIYSMKPPGTPPDGPGLAAGNYDAMLVAMRDYLISLNVPMTFTYWHEPRNEIAPADYIAGWTRILDIFEGVPSQISLGPILNGFLLDSDTTKPEFEAFMPDSLLGRWDFVALDCYQNGTNAAPGTKSPGRAIPNLVNLLSTRGHPNMPVGVGEFNGLSGAMITDAGNTFLNTPTLWFALLWVGVSNSNGVDWILSQEEINAYQAILADSRVKKDTTANQVTPSASLSPQTYLTPRGD